MSIANLLENPAKPWMNIYVHNVEIDGGLNLTGNMTITNSDPSISIINNTANGNHAKLLLNGRSETNLRCYCKCTS